MAIKTIITLVDDLDGQPIDEGKGVTVKFALEGTSYEIDLSHANVTKLRAALKPFVEAARKAGRTTTTRASTGRNSKGELAAIRTWAATAGLPAPARGRIPASTVEAYNASK